MYDKDRQQSPLPNQALRPGATVCYCVRMCAAVSSLAVGPDATYLRQVLIVHG